MYNKGFTEPETNIETPNDIGMIEKPLEVKEIRKKRVDINVLKSKLKETESKEFKRNVYFLVLLVLGLSILGVYVSL